VKGEDMELFFIVSGAFLFLALVAGAIAHYLDKEMYR